MRDLATGERVALDAQRVTITVEGPQLDNLGPYLGAVLVAQDAHRQAPRSFPPISMAAQDTRPGASFGSGGVISLDFGAIPADVERLMAVLYITGGVGAGITFRDFGSLSATVADYRYKVDLTSRGDAALILVEIYRHKGQWRLAANGQGFTGGIAAVASALGIAIDVPQPGPPSLGETTPPAFDYGQGPSRGGGGPSSGSGFAVDRRHILTNAHVVDGCTKFSVQGDHVTLQADLVFSDPRNDIAMLRVREDLAGAAQFREELDIHLGEDIIVLGFPLQGLLGAGPQVTSGNISSLCGLGNDTGVIQFTAPISSGNSGGPILDSVGLVIGIVHSSLNTERIRQGGGVAENINFGAKGVCIRTFLSTSGIEPQLGRAAEARSRAEIVREARRYLYRIDSQP